MYLNEDGTLDVGPKRVYPVSIAADKYPYYAEEIKGCSKLKTQKLLYSQVVDGFMRLKDVDVGKLGDIECLVWEQLKDGPKTLAYLAAKLSIGPNLIKMDRLIDMGVMARISLTPTDVLIAAGEYRIWSPDAAIAAADVLAMRAGVSREEFIKKATDAVIRELCYTVFQSVSEYEGNSFNFKEDDVARYFISKQLSQDAARMLTCLFSPAIPIIGIGAPVEAWLPKMNEKLRGKLIIPPNPEVANAVGSATSKIMETVKILIRSEANSNTYVLHSSWEKRNFEPLDEATEYGLSTAREKAEEIAVNAGAKDFSLISEHQHFYVRSGRVTEKVIDDIFIETNIEATAVERPEWERDSQQ